MIELYSQVATNAKTTEMWPTGAAMLQKANRFDGIQKVEKSKKSERKSWRNQKEQEKWKNLFHSLEVHVEEILEEKKR